MNSFQIFQEINNLTENSLIISEEGEILKIKELLDKIRELNALGKLSIPAVKLVGNNFCGILIEAVDSAGNFQIVGETTNKISMEKINNRVEEITNLSYHENRIEKIKKLLQLIDEKDNENKELYHQVILKQLLKYLKEREVSISDLRSHLNNDKQLSLNIFKIFQIDDEKGKRAKLILENLLEISEENNAIKSFDQKIRRFYIRGIIELIKDQNVEGQRFLIEILKDKIEDERLKYDFEVLRAITYYQDGSLREAIDILNNIDNVGPNFADEEYIEEQINKTILTGQRLVVFNQLIIDIIKRRIKFRLGEIESVVNQEQKLQRKINESRIILKFDGIADILGISILEGIEHKIPQIINILHSDGSIEMENAIRGAKTIRDQSLNSLLSYYSTIEFDLDGWDLSRHVIQSDLCMDHGEHVKVKQFSEAVITSIEEMKPDEKFFAEIITDPSINPALSHSRKFTTISKAYALNIALHRRLDNISEEERTLDQYSSFVKRFSTKRQIGGYFREKAKYLVAKGRFYQAKLFYEKAKLLLDRSTVGNEFVGEMINLVFGYHQLDHQEIINHIDLILKEENELDQFWSFQLNSLKVKHWLRSGKLSECEVVIEELLSLDDEAVIQQLSDRRARVFGNQTDQKESIDRKTTEEEIFDFDYPNLYIFKGSIDMYRGKYEQAIGNFDQARRLWDNYGNNVSMGLALLNKGFALHNLGRYEEAIKFYEQSLGIFRSNNDGKNDFDKYILASMKSLSVAYRELKHYDEHFQVINLIKKLVLRSNDKSIQGSSEWLSLQLGNYYLGIEEYEEAIGYFEQILTKSSKSFYKLHANYMQFFIRIEGGQLELAKLSMERFNRLLSDVQGKSSEKFEIRYHLMSKIYLLTREDIGYDPEQFIDILDENKLMYSDRIRFTYYLLKYLINQQLDVPEILRSKIKELAKESNDDRLKDIIGELNHNRKKYTQKYPYVWQNRISNKVIQESKK